MSVVVGVGYVQGDKVCLGRGTYPLQYTWADPRWGVRHASSPSESKFLHFHVVFGKKLQNNRLAHPLWKLVPPPLRKILDPPLMLQGSSSGLTLYRSRPSLLVTSGCSNMFTLGLSWSKHLIATEMPSCYWYPSIQGLGFSQLLRVFRKF